MGTSINCIIPKEEDITTEEIRQKLDNVFERLKAEILHLKEFGDFSKEENWSWFINTVSAESDQPEYIMGEGGSFDILVYKNVIVIGCVERFGSLYFKEKNISGQLLKIIIELAKEFRTSNKLLLSAGGFGDTDDAIDMAYYDNADFDQICYKMTELHGIPAANLEDLMNLPWYLRL